MIKKLLIVLIAGVMVAGCSNTVPPDTSGNKLPASEELSIPTQSLSSEYYRVLLPYKPSPIRGLSLYNLDTRLDVNEMETGLMRHSMSQYPVDKVLYQEGQYLTREMVSNWLERKLTDDEYAQKKKQDSEAKNLGLNPSSKEVIKTDNGYTINPIYLSHIIEQDYVQVTADKDVKLEGISIALALNPFQKYELQSGYVDTYVVSDDVLLNAGRKMAEQIIKELREIPELKNVPIVVGLYRMNTSNSLVPGNYMATAVSPKGSTQLKDFKNVNEKYFLAPSDEHARSHQAVNQTFADFKKSVLKYFPEYTSIIGEAFYIDEQLKKLNVDISVQFRGEAEIIGFSQYVADVAKNILPPEYNYKISIKSSNKVEALIFIGDSQNVIVQVID